MADGTESLLVLENVALRSPSGRTIFSGVSWTLPPGARFRIGGGRGTGATALLRLAAGLAHPQLGRVVLDGVPHHPSRFDHPFLRRGAVAWVPQDGDLIANLTLLQNVALPLRFVQGKSQEDAEEMALGVLRRLSLEGEASLRPHALSRKERKLGALARSSLAGAELWLVDRLLDGLDDEERRAAVDLLAERLEPSGVTMLIAGDGPDFERLAPGTLRLEAGRISLEEET
jgi:ABC-type lipoprotein export system ATPase subunit